MLKMNWKLKLAEALGYGIVAAALTAALLVLVTR